MNTTTITFLAGSPYHVESVLGVDPYEQAASGRLTHLLLNQPPICDSHCRRCFMPTERRNHVNWRLSLEESIKVIRDAAVEGMFCLEISGEGEPLLSKSLYGIIETAYGEGYITTLITNGHLLNPENIPFFFDHNVTLVVSLFSLNKAVYEMDIGLRNSFEKTMSKIEMAAKVFANGTKIIDGKTVQRMAIHTTAQSDNIEDLKAIASFCHDRGIFWSVAPLAPVGCGENHKNLLLSQNEAWAAHTSGDNSIILSQTSKKQFGRQVCGTCAYGLNIGFDGNLLFDVHAGYEIGDLLGNIRTHSIKELVAIQREITKELFQHIDGYCPVRDPKWQSFITSYLAQRQKPPAIQFSNVAYQTTSL